MEHHELWFTALLNQVFGGPVVSLLRGLGIEPESAAHPIPNYVAMQIVVALILMGLLAWLGRRLSVDRPGNFQQVMELVIDGLGTQCEEVIGHGSRKFLPFLFTLALFIFLCNILGTIPTLETPTDQIYVTVGCALVAFTYYNYAGMRHHGVLKYIATFMGPIWWMAIVMFPIEIVSHLGRVLSLSVRLFANMMAGHQVTLIFFALTHGVLVPVIFMSLHLFVGALQAFIFVVLTMVYLAGAVAEEH
ncbi:MAG: F0F1 ATP synthase subunit A [Acidobacteria bacterium]|nr:F0F1 ATP synthase subunit A [Acidobacteriota bacterium]